MRPVIHIRRLEAASGFEASVGGCVPQRDRPAFRVVVERHDRDTCTRGRPEDKRAGHAALREGTDDAQPAVGHAQLVTAVGHAIAALTDDDVRLRERLPGGEREHTARHRDTQARRFAHHAASSPTMPRRNASTQTTKIAPVITVTHSPKPAR